MSSACLTLHNTGFTPRGTDRAFSFEGTDLTARIVASVESLRESETVGRAIANRRLALDEAVEECSVPNWDGYGAAPANGLSIEWAGRFLEDLPTSVRDPEIAIDPQGDVVLDWILENGHMLSVSISAVGEISYAMRSHSSKFTGIEPYTDDIPPRLAEALAPFIR